MRPVEQIPEAPPGMKQLNEKELALVRRGKRLKAIALYLQRVRASRRDVISLIMEAEERTA